MCSGLKTWQKAEQLIASGHAGTPLIEAYAAYRAHRDKADPQRSVVHARLQLAVWGTSSVPTIERKKANCGCVQETANATL